LDKVTVRLNGNDVTAALHRDAATHTLMGLVSGLKMGENTLEVFGDSDRAKPDEKLMLKNYPITGPVFSGPQEQPFLCQTQDFKLPDDQPLGAPLDANCSVKTVVTYVYKSTTASPAPANGRGGAPALKPL